MRGVLSSDAYLTRMARRSVAYQGTHRGSPGRGCGKAGIRKAELDIEFPRINEIPSLPKRSG